MWLHNIVRKIVETSDVQQYATNVTTCLVCILLSTVKILLTTFLHLSVQVTSRMKMSQSRMFPVHHSALYCHQTVTHTDIFFFVSTTSKAT